MNADLMCSILDLSPIKFKGIFTEPIECSCKNCSSLLFQDNHWILFGKYQGESFYFDSQVLGHTSSTCGVFCIIFLFTLAVDGKQRAEDVYTHSLQTNSKELDLLFVETLQRMING